MMSWLRQKRIAALEEELRSADRSERAAAAQGLAALGEPQWGTWIRGDHRDFKRLGACPDPRVFDWLVEASRDPKNCAGALAGLGRVGDPRAIPRLREALSKPETKGIAARALERLGEPCLYRTRRKRRLSLITAEEMPRRVDPNNRPPPRGGDHEDISGAACDGDVAAIEALLAAGADIDEREETWIWNSEQWGSIETGGWTPLMYAVANGHLDAARLLIERGADLDATSVPPLNESTLALAVEHGDLEMTDLLLDAGAKPDPLTAGHHTPLTLAAAYGEVGIVRTLLRHGAEVDHRLYLGGTALDSAAGAGHEEIVDMLLASGGAIEPATENSRSALNEAAFDGRKDIVETLIEAGADVDRRCFDETPLMVAVQRGKADVARMLLDAGADVNAQTEIGRSPLFMAVEEGDVAMLRLLRERGADPQLTAWQQRWRGDEDLWFQFTPLMLAAEEGNLKMVRVLRKASPGDAGEAVNGLLEAGLPLEQVCEMFEIDADGRRRLENFLAGGLM